jgi:lipoate-protein ligase A
VSEPILFDAESLRTLGRRTAFVRVIERPTLVLGSTQDQAIVDAEALDRHRVDLVRRRSGGGAVLVEPGRAVWIDTWVPRQDPLFDDDVGRSRSWVGSWWVAAMADNDLAVHQGRPIASRWSERICFAGVDVGEVLYRGRKVVGVAQWRSREGALTHSFAYLDARWRVLAELLDLIGAGSDVVGDLVASTATLPEVLGPEAYSLSGSLLERLPDPDSWSIERPGG